MENAKASLASDTRERSNQNITDRDPPEQAMQRRERLYRAIGESIDYGVWVCEPDGRNIYASRSFLKLVGLTQEQCSNFGWGDVLHPEDAARTIAAWKECVRTGGRWDIEHRFRGVDSQWRHILTRGVPVKNEHGQILCWAGINLDITERKRTEETLRFLLQCGAAASGEDFFQALARYLGQSLGMDYVCIDRLEEGSLAARTVAIYFDGKFEDNVSYTLKDTPCGDVGGKTICCFPRDVRHLFPKDAVLQEILAESYVGVTLWGSQGQPIGLIALLGRKPLADPRLATSILQLVAVRAAAELERRGAEAEVRRHADELVAANQELTRFNQAAVGRELRMIELKQEVNALCAQLGQPARYGPEPDDEARPKP
jgi:PAS domain S-box-containing protein